MEAYAYVRVSMDEGDQAFDQQLNAISSFCDGYGYHIKKVYSEQASEAITRSNRPVFIAMLADIRNNGVRTIVIESLNTLTGKDPIREQLLIYLASKKINVIVSDTGEDLTGVITNDPLCRAMIKMHDVFEELDKALLVTRIRMAKERFKDQRGKSERGRFEGGYPEVLKEIRRLRQRRKGIVNLTYKKIAQELNQRGFSAVRGIPLNDRSAKEAAYRPRKTNTILDSMVREAV